MEKRVSLNTHSRYFTTFYSFPAKKYLQKTHYFEKHEAAIELLPEEEKYFIITSYVEALFELSVFDKFLIYVDELINFSINTQFEQDPNVFIKLLEQKSTAAFRIEKYEASLHISKELLKMDPSNRFALNQFEKCERLKLKRTRYQFKKIFVTLLSTLMVGYFLKEMLIAPFYDQYNSLFNKINFSLIGLLVISTTYSEIKIKKTAKKKMNEYLTMLQIRKK